MNEHEKNIEAMKDLRARIDKVLEGQTPEKILEHKHPDPLKHKYISFIKSGLRIVAGACFIAAGYTLSTDNWLVAGGVFLIGAEILGVVEEMV